MEERAAIAGFGDPTGIPRTGWPLAPSRMTFQSGGVGLPLDGDAMNTVEDETLANEPEALPAAPAALEQPHEEPGILPGDMPMVRPRKGFSSNPEATSVAEGFPQPKNDKQPNPANITNRTLNFIHASYMAALYEVKERLTRPQNKPIAFRNVLK
jgi:hypothetical protein